MCGWVQIKKLNENIFSMTVPSTEIRSVEKATRSLDKKCLVLLHYRISRIQTLFFQFGHKKKERKGFEIIFLIYDVCSYLFFLLLANILHSFLRVGKKKNIKKLPFAFCRAQLHIILCKSGVILRVNFLNQS
jgi:hypothetical protein